MQSGDVKDHATSKYSDRYLFPVAMVMTMSYIVTTYTANMNVHAMRVTQDKQHEYITTLLSSVITIATQDAVHHCDSSMHMFKVEASRPVLPYLVRDMLSE